MQDRMAAPTWATFASRAGSVTDADELRAMRAEVQKEIDARVAGEPPIRIQGTCTQLRKVRHAIERRITAVGARLTLDMSRHPASTLDHGD